jgi:host factor-I protein
LSGREERKVKNMAGKGTIVLQDVFLNQLRKDYIPITIHLINGFQLRGIIKGFDNFVVILESDGKQMMIYKHAISTVTPSRPITFGSGSETQENE